MDDDADGQINWDEFKTMFYRIRDDQSGYEPRKLFNVVEFLMYDKNFNGSIDLDECISILYQRFGKVCTRSHLQSHALPPACILLTSNLHAHAQAAVDTAMSEVKSSSEDEKSVSFSTFVDIQAKATKAVRCSGLKVGATMVPQVKGLSYGADPSLSHLM